MFNISHFKGFRDLLIGHDIDWLMEVLADYVVIEGGTVKNNRPLSKLSHCITESLVDNINISRVFIFNKELEFFFGDNNLSLGHKGSDQINRILAYSEFALNTLECLSWSLKSFNSHIHLVNNTLNNKTYLDIYIFASTSNECQVKYIIYLWHHNHWISWRLPWWVWLRSVCL